jgi:mono/diheme cytochrome c family protein
LIMHTMRLSAIVFIAAAAFAQHPESLRAGRQLFVRNCSACHGDTGKGAPRA